MALDVVGIGILGIDYSVELNRMPGINSHEPALATSWQGGCQVATALATLGRLGAVAGLIAVYADDLFGEFCVEDLKRHGVDTSRMKCGGSRTRQTICLAEKATHSRSFISRAGDVRPLTVEDLDESYICSAKYLHLAGMKQVEIAAARMARSHHTPVVMDADKNQGVENNLELIDVLIGSSMFYESLFSDLEYEKNLKSIAAKGPNTVVITLGDKGSVGVCSEGYFEMPAFAGIDVRDTTGAGDVFHGAFIYGLLQGWTTRETTRFAGAVAAIKCTRLGGRAGISDRKTVDRFLTDGVIDYASIDERVRFYENGVFGSESK